MHYLQVSSYVRLGLRLSHWEIAALVGMAPMKRDSGRKRDYRATQGGRPDVRSALYMSALTGIRYNSILKMQYA